MKFLSKTVLILGAVAMIACGDKKEEKEDKITIGDGTSPQSQTEAATDKSASEMNSSDEDVVEVTIEGNDQMRFNKDEIKVKAGQTV